MKLTLILLLVVVTLSACATKRYGRAVEITPTEQEALNCREINIEIAKVDGMIKQITEKSKFDGMDVAAFLGDFGIGNKMELDAALASANTRKTQLTSMKTAKRCP